MAEVIDPPPLLSPISNERELTRDRLVSLAKVSRGVQTLIGAASSPLPTFEIVSTSAYLGDLGDNDGRNTEYVLEMVIQITTMVNHEPQET